MAEDRNLPDYEEEAQRIEREAKARADAIRQAGQAQRPRAMTVDRLYTILGIEPVKGDRAEAKRRKALEARVTELSEFWDAQHGDGAPAATSSPQEPVQAPLRASEPQGQAQAAPRPQEGSQGLFGEPDAEPRRRRGEYADDDRRSGSSLAPEEEGQP